MLRITPSLVERFKQFDLTPPKVRLFRYYGMHKIANAYLGFPSWFPVDYLTYLEHGISFQRDLTDKRLEIIDQEVCLLNNENRKRSAQKIKKDAHAIGPLFIRYRELEGIQQSVDAKGTISFPAHSIPGISTAFDWEQYAKDLLNLPEDFHPIRVCIYWRDIVNERHLVFEKLGIETFTCGYVSNEDYAQNFYALVKSAKYVTSNSIGSYSCYAIEMGLPFFLYGPKNHYIAGEGAKDVAILRAIEQNKIYTDLYSAFYYSLETIENKGVELTPEQLRLHRFFVDPATWSTASALRRRILLKIPLILFSKIANLFRRK